MAQIVRKGTPRGQTDANQAYRTDRGVSSGGYDSSGTLGADLSRHRYKGILKYILGYSVYVKAILHYERIIGCLLSSHNRECHHNPICVPVECHPSHALQQYLKMIIRYRIRGNI